MYDVGKSGVQAVPEVATLSKFNDIYLTPGVQGLQVSI